MHHRDRAAPVALARQAPVAQAILGDAGAKALGFHVVDGGVDRLLPRGHVEAGKMVQPLHLFGLGRHEGGVGDRFGAVQRLERVDHRQVILAAEIEVALVMGGHAEDRAGAVIHQDEIGDPDRHLPVGVQRMARAQPGVDAQFLRLFNGFFRGAALAHLATLAASRGFRPPAPLSAGGRATGR